MNLRDIKLLGVFADSLRYEVRENGNTEHVYFHEELFAYNNEKGYSEKKATIHLINIMLRRLRATDLYIVAIKLGKAFFYSHTTTQKDREEDAYIIYVEEVSPIPDEDTPF